MSRSAGTRWMLTMALALFAPGLWWVSSDAATHYVAKDGTGHFDVIQDALDAAAPGDTIRIGAGRYAELVEYPSADINGALIGVIRTGDLTILGSDADSVAIGPVVVTPSSGGLVTGGFAIPGGVERTVISRVTVENVAFGITLGEAATIVETVLQECTTGHIALLEVDGLQLLDSEIRWQEPNNLTSGVLSFVGHSNPNGVIRGCTFSGNMGVGVSWDGASGSSIESCTFDGLVVGVNLLRSTNTVVAESEFTRCENVAVIADEASQVDIRDCEISESLHRGIWISGSVARIDRTSISGGDFGAVWFAGGVDVIMRDCDILNSEGPHVYSRASSEFTTQIDLRHNFWGSTDSVEIAGWIDDGADDGPGDCVLSYCPRDTVEFWPVLERSVDSKPVSTGSFKSRFRRRN